MTLQATEGITRLYEFGILGIFAGIFLLAIWRLWDNQSKLNEKHAATIKDIYSEHKKELLQLHTDMSERDKMNLLVLEKIKERVVNSPEIVTALGILKTGQETTHRKIDDLRK